MKGPYERLKYDLRRVFECPRCHRRVRMPGNVTFVACSCSGNTSSPESVWMRLVEDDSRRTDGRQLAVRSRWPACPDGRFPDDPITDSTS